jgi:hypothetical protein
MTTLLFVLGLALVLQQPSAPIRFEPTSGVPSFAVREPVLRITPAPSSRPARSRALATTTSARAGAWPGEVGPFHIEGATPNDTLVVHPPAPAESRYAVSAVNPGGISAVVPDSRTRMMTEPLPARRFVWRLDLERNVGILDLPNSASKRIEMPLADARPPGRCAGGQARYSAACGLATSAATWTPPMRARARPSTCRVPRRRALLLRRRPRASG